MDGGEHTEMNKDIQNIIDTIVERDSQDERRASATLSQIYDAIEELTEHPTCETCAHWGKEYEADELGRKDCESIDNTDDSHIGTKGWVLFRTKPDFYCKLHKPKVEIENSEEDLAKINFYRRLK